MNRILKALSGFFLSITLLALLNGCASRPIIRSEVTRFHTFGFTPVSGTFHIMPNQEQRQSLEFSAYANLIASELIARGWQQEQNPDAKPQMSVCFVYGVDDGKMQIYSEPVYGQTGGGSSSINGTVSSGMGEMAHFSGTASTPATYGMVGSTTQSYTEYTRLLQLNIFDNTRVTNNSPTKVFESRVRSTGSKAEISLVMPAMIEALFKDFPGVSGESHVIYVWQPANR